MTNNQKQIIREKAVISDWMQPADRDVDTCFIVFDIYELLPDENVSAFLMECPSPPSWHYDEDGWICFPEYEQREWQSTAVINRYERKNNQKTMDALKESKIKAAFHALIDTLEKVTDYTYRKSPEEMLAMWKEFERIKKQKPELTGGEDAVSLPEK